MKKKRKTEISLEVEETIAIRTGRVLVTHCRQCLKQVRMVAANEAAMIAGLSTRDIYRFVENGQLHFTEDPSGLLFVCFESLHQLVNGDYKEF